MIKEFSRRKLLLHGRDIVLASALTYGISACSLSEKKVKTDWDKDLASFDNQGSAFIKKLSGKAVIGDISARTDAEVKSGDEVQVAGGGVVLLAMADNSLIKVTGRASLTMRLDSKGGGYFQIKRGSVLSAISRRKKRPYIYKGATAMVGVKGTVLFNHVFDGEETMDSRTPESATDYVCICHGNIDYVDPTDSRVVKSDTGFHHSAKFIGAKNGEMQFQKAGFLLNHSDQEIYDLIEEMEGEKLDRNWLELDSDSSGYD